MVDAHVLFGLQEDSSCACTESWLRLKIPNLQLPTHTILSAHFAPGVCHDEVQMAATFSCWEPSCAALRTAELVTELVHRTCLRIRFEERGSWSKALADPPLQVRLD